jgi:hypothetical protein
MPRLKDRSRQIPGGLKFIEPATKWQPPPFSSFDTIVRLLVQHRQANAVIAQQNKWSTAYDEIADEVDAYNARICATHGWNEFIVAGDTPPKPEARSSSSPAASAGRVVAGVKLLVDWLGEGGTPVDNMRASMRAAVCAGCPQNGKGDWTRWFTVPASNLIRKQIAIRQDLDLSTPHDGDLGVCEACGCPLKLKVHTPMDVLAAHTRREALQEMPQNCWIKTELHMQ